MTGVQAYYYIFCCCLFLYKLDKVKGLCSRGFSAFLLVVVFCVRSST